MDLFAIFRSTAYSCVFLFGTKDRDIDLFYKKLGVEFRIKSIVKADLQF